MFLPATVKAGPPAATASPGRSLPLFHQNLGRTCPRSLQGTLRPEGPGPLLPARERSFDEASLPSECHLGWPHTPHTIYLVLPLFPRINEVMMRAGRNSELPGSSPPQTLPCPHLTSPPAQVFLSA